MYQVIKRDGKIAEFDISKISAAIKKAFEATNVEYNDDIIDFLALKVTADYASKVKDGKIQVEDIQDSVESVLSRGGYEEVAKAYILYRKQREKIRNVKATMLDYKELVNDYVNSLDWRVKENSTVTYSVGGLILSNSGAITANYWLSEVYDQEIADAHRLLRRLVLEAAHQGRLGRHSGENHLRTRQALSHPVQPDGQFPRHHAERMGRRTGLLLL